LGAPQQCGIFVFYPSAIHGAIPFIRQSWRHPAPHGSLPSPIRLTLLEQRQRSSLSRFSIHPPYMARFLLSANLGGIPPRLASHPAWLSSRPARLWVYFGLLLLDDLTPQGAYLDVRTAWKLAYEDALMTKDVVREAQNHPKVFILVYFPSIRPTGLPPRLLLFLAFSGGRYARIFVSSPRLRVFDLPNYLCLYRAACLSRFIFSHLPRNHHPSTTRALPKP